jgi:hypothetical protein
MFCGCTSLTCAILSNLDLRNVKYAARLFSGCTSLSSVDFSNTTTERLKDADSAFKDCVALKSLDQAFFTPRLKHKDDIFANCRFFATPRGRQLD